MVVNLCWLQSVEIFIEKLLNLIYGGIFGVMRDMQQRDKNYNVNECRRF